MIKAIETHYNGYKFRSRLEARWAVFFDAMDCRYVYEHQGFDMGEHGQYLPDFVIGTGNQLDIFVEVKASLQDEEALLKPAWLAATLKYPVIITTLLENSASFLFRPVLDAEGLFVATVAWAQCIRCGMLGVLDMADLDFYCTNTRECMRNGRYKVKLDKFNPCQTDKINHAYNVARSARFEHGETPRTPRGRPRQW